MRIRPYYRLLRRRLLGRFGALDVLPAVHSAELGNTRDLLVHLPQSYTGSRKRYPVLYMHDGQNLFDPATSFAGAWRVDRALAAVRRRGIEAIVVGIPNAGAGRIREYSPFATPVTGEGGGGGGLGEKYLDFVIQTVKPLIDQRYRTRRERECTGLAGSSMGGLISLYAFFRRPAVFGFAGVLSPAVWFADAALLEVVRAAEYVPGRLYLDVGGVEGERTVLLARRLRDLLIEKGYRRGRDLMWVEDPRGRHQEAFWGRRLRRALPFLLEPSAASSPS